MPVTRDTNGFIDAMKRMRVAMGTQVPFYKTTTPTYPLGTALDPESGKPHDPTIAASGGANTSSVTLTVGVYRGRVPAGREDDTVETAIGRLEEGEALLDVDVDEYDDNALDDATEVEVFGERYEIFDRDRDQVDGIEHRVLAWVRKEVVRG